MKNSFSAKPSYPIEAVDKALHLLQLIRDLGSIRLKDAAEEVGVAPSTAHRLLGMLVYRGFAVQDESHCYLPGPSVGVGPAGGRSSQRLRTIALPRLEELADELSETCYLMIRSGPTVRFLCSAGGANRLSIGDRQGAVLPVHRTSGGKALLATLDRETISKQLTANQGDVAAGYGISGSELPRFLNELDSIRRAHYATNYEETETGVAAIGMALRDGTGDAVGAFSVAVSVSVSKPKQLVELHFLPQMFETRRQIERGLADAGPLDQRSS